MILRPLGGPWPWVNAWGGASARRVGSILSHLLEAATASSQVVCMPSGSLVHASEAFIDSHSNVHNRSENRSDARIANLLHVDSQLSTHIHHCATLPVVKYCLPA